MSALSMDPCGVHCVCCIVAWSLHCAWCPWLFVVYIPSCVWFPSVCSVWRCPECIVYGLLVSAVEMVSMLPGSIHSVWCIIPWCLKCPWCPSCLVVSFVSGVRFHGVCSVHIAWSYPYCLVYGSMVSAEPTVLLVRVSVHSVWCIDPCRLQSPWCSCVACDWCLVSWCLWCLLFRVVSIVSVDLFPDV